MPSSSPHLEGQCTTGFSSRWVQCAVLYRELCVYIEMLRIGEIDIIKYLKDNYSQLISFNQMETFFASAISNILKRRSSFSTNNTLRDNVESYNLYSNHLESFLRIFHTK